jgi:hypothetical protein
VALIKKNTLLLLGFVATLWFLYIVAFSQTLALNEKAASLQKQQELRKKNLLALERLMLEDAQTDRLLVDSPISDETFLQNNLLEIVNDFAQKEPLSIVSFHEPHAFKEDNTVFKTYSFCVIGPYASLLKLIHALEQKHAFGNVQTAVFEKKKNPRNGQVSLECMLSIQRIGQ